VIAILFLLVMSKTLFQKMYLHSIQNIVFIFLRFYFLNFLKHVYLGFKFIVVVENVVGDLSARGATSQEG
jgi:hypothetical protein